jgi:hypothetical protein
MSEVTKVTQGDEVLDTMTAEEAASVEVKATELYNAAERNYVRFAAELRRLQDGGAHFARGYRSFGEYAEAVFEGMNANTARQLSRQGQVLLVLEKANRVDLDKGEKLPRSHGVRALAVILGKYGEDPMLAIFDRANATGRGITEATVSAAVAQVIVPTLPIDELGPGAEPEPLPDDETDEEAEEVERHHDLLDRIDMVRRYLDDMVDCLEDDETQRAGLALLGVKGEVEILDKLWKGEYDTEWIERSRGDDVEQTSTPTVPPDQTAML